MATRITIAAIVLFAAMFAMAQEQKTTNASQITIRGCIMGSQRYTFMQASTGAEYDLTEAPASKDASGGGPDFSSLRGKLIELTGNEYAPESGKNSNELPTLSVSKARVIADQCPIHPGSVSRANASRNRAPATAKSPATPPPYVDPGTETQTPPNINNPNINGDSGAPSPGTGNQPAPPK
jgi:hypothetical protein